MHPLMLAILNDHKDAVTMLLENGATIDDETTNKAMDMFKYDMVDLLLDYGAIIPSYRLHYDCEHNNYTNVVYLIENHIVVVDINAIDNLYTTPIAIACIKGHIEIVEYLLNKGIDINSGVIGSQTLLHIAASTNNIHTIKFLLEHGANIDIQDRRGRTPLTSAADNDCIEASKYLDDHGANRYITKPSDPYKSHRSDPPNYRYYNESLQNRYNLMTAMRSIIESSTIVYNDHDQDHDHTTNLCDQW